MPIGGPTGEHNPCFECNGTGLLEGEFHYPCLGTGYRGGKELQIFLKNLSDNVDSIIAEQASQREDLTAALTQIWNKVKDL